jgi:hypothetical protein
VPLPMWRGRTRRNLLLWHESVLRVHRLPTPMALHEDIGPDIVTLVLFAMFELFCSALPVTTAVSPNTRTFTSERV